MSRYVGVAIHAITGKEIIRSPEMNDSRGAYCWAFDNSQDERPRRVKVEVVE